MARPTSFLARLPPPPPLLLLLLLLASAAAPVPGAAAAPAEARRAANATTAAPAGGLEDDGALWESIVTMLVIVGMLVAMAKEVAPPDMIMMLCVAVFIALRIITVEEGVEGFANTGMLTVAVLFAVAAGIQVRCGEIGGERGERRGEKKRERERRTTVSPWRLSFWAPAAGSAAAGRPLGASVEHSRPLQRAAACRAANVGMQRSIIETKGERERLRRRLNGRPTDPSTHTYTRTHTHTHVRPCALWE